MRIGNISMRAMALFFLSTALMTPLDMYGAEIIEVRASRDNTLYEDEEGRLSNRF